HPAHIAAALGGAFDLHAAGTGGHVAVPDVYVLYAAAHLAANADAVPAKALAVKHTDVFCGPGDLVALGVFAGFDGDRVVLRLKHGGEQRAVGGGIGVPAVAVPDADGAQGAVVGH